MNVKTLSFLESLIKNKPSASILCYSNGSFEDFQTILDLIQKNKGGNDHVFVLNENKENKLNIKLTSDITKKLQAGTNQIKIFGISNSVLKPDIYETNFIITKEKSEIPKTEINFQTIENEINYDMEIIAITIAVIMIGITIFLKKRS